MSSYICDWFRVPIFINWTNSNDIKKICPNFTFCIWQKSLDYYSSLLAPFSPFSILMMPWTLLMSLVTHFCAFKHLNKHQQSWSHPRPRWRTFLLKWCIMLATSMDSSSYFSLPSTVSSTSNSHDLNVLTNVENIKKTLMSTIVTTAYRIKDEKNSNWSDTSKY